MKSRVILLAGAGGSGKSTIAALLSKRYGYQVLQGDHEDSEFFPNGGQWLPQNLELLKKAHQKVLRKAKELVCEGKFVVIDYIIFGDYLSYFNVFKDTFDNDLEIAILFPSKAETIKRDSERESWTTGSDRIASVRSELYKIKDQIGEEKFIDTSNESPEGTVKKHFQAF